MTDQVPTAIVIGGDRPFGAEIVEGLQKAGYEVRSVGHAGDPSVAAAGNAIEVFVLNTPVKRDGVRFLDITQDLFIGALETQLYEVFAAGQAAASQLKRSGSMVHVASRAHLGAWGGAHQVAAGAALIGLSRSMALEFESQDVRVNTLAADFVGEAWDTPAARAALADAVVFLAGPGSKLLSGETLLLDQARSLRMTESAKR